MTALFYINKFTNLHSITAALIVPIAMLSILLIALTLHDLIVNRFDSRVATPGARQFCAMIPNFNSEIQMTSSP